jgi:hypothetical protein
MLHGARGELVQRALLVGLGVQPRRHGEERVEAQQHLREYSEYQTDPRIAYREYGGWAQCLLSGLQRTSASGTVGVLCGTVGVLWGYCGLQRTSASSMNCEKSSIALPAVPPAHGVLSGYSGGTLLPSTPRLLSSRVLGSPHLRCTRVLGYSGTRARKSHRF